MTKGGELDKILLRVLVILGDGGHTAEMMKLLNLLGPNYAYSYLIGCRDQVSLSKIRFSGLVYRAHSPREKRANWLKNLGCLALCIAQEVTILLRARPQAILSSGAGIAVPISVMGRLLGVKIVHVETGSRVYTLSTTGKIMYRVSHLFFVQWESLRKDYPKAIYAGRLI